MSRDSVDVRKKSSFLNRWLYHGCITAVVVLLIILLFSANHHVTVKAKANSLLHWGNADTIHIQIPKQSTRMVSHDFMLSELKSHHVSKKYLARQNAPTMMYRNNPLLEKNKQDRAALMRYPRQTVAQGEFIHAILETAINSDLPGMVRAIVSRPVYSYRGEQVLIPAGSRLIGRYSAKIVQSQQRVFVIWNRLLLPNGLSLSIKSSSADALGQSGQAADYINTHFFARFGQATLLSMIGAGVSTYGVSADQAMNSASLYQSAIAQSFQQSANQSLQNTLPTKPTLIVHQGTRIVVFVAHDLPVRR